MELRHASLALRRALAFALDWLVLAAWGGLLFGAVRVASGGAPPAPDGPWRGQALGFAAMTLPALLYFAGSESSPWRASLGKRLVGLEATRADGGRLGLGRALARNALKLAPWELGHLVAWQAIAAGDSPPPAWVYLPMALSMLGPLWWLASLVARGDTPYDRWAGARVISDRARPRAPRA